MTPRAQVPRPRLATEAKCYPAAPVRPAEEPHDEEVLSSSSGPWSSGGSRRHSVRGQAAQTTSMPPRGALLPAMIKPRRREDRDGDLARVLHTRPKLEWENKSLHLMGRVFSSSMVRRVPARATRVQRIVSSAIMLRNQISNLVFGPCALQSASDTTSYASHAVCMESRIARKAALLPLPLCR